MIKTPSRLLCPIATFSFIAKINFTDKNSLQRLKEFVNTFFIDYVIFRNTGSTVLPVH
jgi:hypothetical protein